jgi:hypothetical protein
MGTTLAHLHRQPKGNLTLAYRVYCVDKRTRRQSFGAMLEHFLHEAQKNPLDLGKLALAVAICVPIAILWNLAFWVLVSIHACRTGWTSEELLGFTTTDDGTTIIGKDRFGDWRPDRAA